MNPLAFVVLVAGAVAVVLGCSLRLVPPSHAAVVTRFGCHTGETKQEGLRLFLMYPHITGSILVPLIRRVENISFPQVLSRDLAQMKFEVNLAWTPSKYHASVFLKNGDVNGAEAVLNDIFKDHLRSWAEKTDWREMFSLEASARVTGFCVSGLTGQEVSQRSISQLQSGSASVEAPAHGIVLHRVNVTSISLSDKHADAAEKLVRTQGNVKADIYEMTAMATAIAKMMNEMGCTFQEATEFVQIERGKISKEIRQSNLNVSGDDLELLRRLTNAQLPRRLP